MRKPVFVVLAVLLLVPVAIQPASGAEPPPSEKSGCEVIVAPYIWATSIEGEVSADGAEAEEVGVALIPRPGTTLIPLVQHFVSYSGDDVNQTAFRLIGLQRLPHRFWGKLDAKGPDPFFLLRRSVIRCRNGVAGQEGMWIRQVSVGGRSRL